MMEKEYVVITTISTHKSRFVIRKDELQKMNTDITLTDESAFEWAGDSVLSNEIKEFSQEWLGDSFIDADIKTKEEILQLFDRENDYLKNWSHEQKMNWINNWRETDV